jgi:hypothetical protein
MRTVSRKRARQLRAYTKLRIDFLLAHPFCQFPGGCGNPTTEIHHRRGRCGPLYLDVATWSGLCSPHHRWVTEHPKAAVEMGISELRIGASP